MNRPTDRIIEWFEEASSEKEEEFESSGKASFVVIPFVRDVPVPGETAGEALARREREAQLETELENEGRRVYTGQVLPISYED